MAFSKEHANYFFTKGPYIYCDWREEERESLKEERMIVS